MSQLHTPSKTVGQYPIQDVDGNLFPPVCLKTHWDPTEMIRRILPQQKVPLPQDFRPLVKVCKNYVTSAPAEEAPMPPDNMVFPKGGSFYPPGRYSANIDVETELKSIHRPLDRWCSTSQYIPSAQSNMYQAGSTVPDRKAISSAFVAELAMPQALLRDSTYSCRTENDTLYFQRSNRLFNNTTKQDRVGADRYYALPGADHGQGDPMPHGGVPQVISLYGPETRNQVYPQPGGGRMPSLRATPPRNTDYTSVVGVATHGSSARVW
jgi:hypothetical protein